MDRGQAGACPFFYGKADEVVLTNLMHGNLPNFRWHRIRQTRTDKQEKAVSIAKNSQITASSNKSFEEAIESGIKRFAKTVDRVQGAWIKEQKNIGIR